MRFTKSVVLSIVAVFFSMTGYAQRTYAPLDPDYYQLYDRLDIMGVLDTSVIHTSVKPYTRGDIALMADRPYLRNSGNKRDQFNWHYLTVDNEFRGRGKMVPALPQDDTSTGDVYQGPYFDPYKPDAPWLKHFFRSPNAFLQVTDKELVMIVNPVMGFSSGIESPGGLTTYQNTRGYQIHGLVGSKKKIGFQTSFTENQFRFPSYYTQEINDHGVLNGAGLIKKFGAGGYDFLDAKGSITFAPIEAINIQFGHDNNFIGNGYRSLILSDNARENLFLKVRTRAWRLQYTNLFMELSDLEKLGGTGNNQRKKFMTFHHLNIKVTKGLSIGMFESVVFARNDSNDTPGYDINYLNPIIFYRSVEHGLNSSDNSLLGVDWKWNFLKHFSFYGQFVLDEFRKDSMVQRTGWWGNKWGFQGGLKWINAFVPNLDLQFETNIVRPYTYTHFTRSQNYIHHNQSLAHPLGANFREYLGIVRYQVSPKLRITALVMYAKHGRDSISRHENIHYGGNILENYNNRPKETNIKIGQGYLQTIKHAEFRASWQIYHNFFMDIVYIRRISSGPIQTFNFNLDLLQLGMRLNLPYKSMDY